MCGYYTPPPPWFPPAAILKTCPSTAGQASVGPNGRVSEGRLLSGNNRLSFNTQLEHTWRGDDLGGYLEIGVSRQRMPHTDFYTSSGQSFSAPLNAADPRNPFRNGVTPGFVGRSINVSWRAVDMPPSWREGRLDTARMVAGIKGQVELWDRSWRWAIDSSWEGNDNDGQSVDYNTGLSRMVTARIYNPVRDVSTQPHDQQLFIDNVIVRRQRHASQVAAFNIRANGDLLRLPAGQARLSLGSEVRWEDFFVRLATRGTGLTSSFTRRTVLHTSRRSTGGYFEATVPIIRGVELNAAGRSEQYDDFKGQNNFLVAAKWTPASFLAMRASYGEAYNPPSQRQLHDPLTDFSLGGGFISLDPLRGDEPIGGPEVKIILGGNPDLRPETSDTGNIGLIIKPAFAPGLTLSLDAFRIRKVDQIDEDLVIEVVLASADLFPGRVVRAAPTSTDIALGWPGVVTQLDSRPINLARVTSRGVDISLNWRIPTEQRGTFDLNATGTYTDSFKTQASFTAPVIEAVGNVGLLGNPPIKFRGNLGLYWEGARWAAGVSARYIHSFSTDTTELTPANELIHFGNIDGKAIDSSLEFDFEVSYRIPYAAQNRPARRSLFDGTRWGIRINNIFDERPPYITDRAGFYSRFNDPRMRYIMLEIKKTL